MYLMKVVNGGWLCMRSTTCRLAVRLLSAMMATQGNGYEEGCVYTKGFSSAGVRGLSLKIGFILAARLQAVDFKVYVARFRGA